MASLTAAGSTKFTFESKDLEFTVSQYRGRYGLNKGLEVKVKAKSTETIIEIACNNFKSEIKSVDSYYKNRASGFAKQINSLIEFMEIIQNQASPEEQDKLEKMRTCMSDICTKAVSWTSDETTRQNLNIWKFIVPGKRVNIDTFELEDQTREDVPQ